MQSSHGRSLCLWVWQRLWWVRYLNIEKHIYFLAKHSYFPCPTWEDVPLNFRCYLRRTVDMLYSFTCNSIVTCWDYNAHCWYKNNNNNNPLKWHVISTVDIIYSVHPYKGLKMNNTISKSTNKLCSVPLIHSRISNLFIKIEILKTLLLLKGFDLPRCAFRHCQIISANHQFKWHVIVCVEFNHLLEWW